MFSFVMTTFSWFSEYVPTEGIHGLCRDDDLGIFKNMSGPEVERKKKELFKIFKNNGLSITVKSNLKIACFLDMHFDLVKYLLI